MDTGDLIEAVRARRVVELVYGDGVRVVHPHAVYRTAAGNLRLDALQVSGVTSSGSLPGWRDFNLMKIADVRVLETTFDVSPEFNLAAERYRHGLLAHP
jgi:hypothetical protein